MKVFAGIVLFICMLGIFIGLLMSTGNQEEQIRGIGLLAGGLAGILPACVLMVLAEIRDLLQKKVDPEKIPAVV